MQISYELTASDMASAQALFWRCRRPLFFWGCSLYGLGTLLFGLLILVRGISASALFLILLGVWLLTYIPLLVPNSARKNWAKLKFMHGVTTLTTSNEGLEMANPMTRFFTRWEAIDNILEGRDVWMLFVGPADFYMIPTRAFSSEAELNQFRNEIYQGKTSSSKSAPIPVP